MPTIFTSKKLPKRKPKDLYITPLEFCGPALEYTKSLVTSTCPNILDPGAGTGNWGTAAKWCFRQSYIHGVDIDKKHRPDYGNRVMYESFPYSEWDVLDFVGEFDNDPVYDLIMGNPPFTLAEEFIRKSLGLLNIHGVLVFLLPDHFRGSAGRGQGLFKEYRPTLIVTPMQRINFENAGHGNPNLYDLFIWKKYEPYSNKVTYQDWLDWR